MYCFFSEYDKMSHFECKPSSESCTLCRYIEINFEISIFLQNNAEFAHIHGNELGCILLLQCLLILLKTLSKNTCTPIVCILNDKESSRLFTYIDQKLTLKYFCLLFMISCILINSSLEYGKSPHFELINELYRLCKYIEMNFEISFLIVFAFIHFLGIQ